MRRFSLLALSLLAACEPPTPEVNVNIVLEPPMEIDTFQDVCDDGGKLVPEPFYSEEMCANVSVPLDDWYVEARQVELDFDDYCVEYLIQNENGTLERYCNGMQLHLDGGETAQVPLRAVAFSQKQEAFDQFGALELQVKATLTMYATNRWNNEQIEAVADYDILMTNFNNCAGATAICDYVLPFQSE
jgi:hypothetical protein